MPGPGRGEGQRRMRVGEKKWGNGLEEVQRVYEKGREYVRDTVCVCGCGCGCGCANEGEGWVKEWVKSVKKG